MTASMNADAEALRALTKAYTAAIKTSAASQAAEAKSSVSSASPSVPKET
jgi:hypothetical protein